MRDCTCSMRDGAHEWWCGKVGEYDFVHCRDCDGAFWMCGVALSRCKKCREIWEQSQECQDQRLEAFTDMMERLKKERKE